MEQEETKLLKNIRIAARILSAFLLFIVLLFLFGEGVPNPVMLTTKELLLFAALIVMGAGLIISLKRELYGGLITILGYIFFAVINKSILAGPIFPLFLVAGLLYIFHWWKSGRLT
jgi:hypothetical protein